MKKWHEMTSFSGWPGFFFKRFLASFAPSQGMCESFRSAVAEGLASNGTMIPSQLGVSENSVPLNPMVNDHYPY